MPFFSHPVDPTAWLLPLVSGMLGASSFLFRIITAIAPYGVVALFIVVVALFSMNLMKDPQPELIGAQLRQPLRGRRPVTAAVRRQRRQRQQRMQRQQRALRQRLPQLRLPGR